MSLKVPAAHARCGETATTAIRLLWIPKEGVATFVHACPFQCSTRFWICVPIVR